MKEIKTRQTNHAPRVLSDTARAPRELAKRSILQAKEKAKQTMERPDYCQEENPEQYAENRVETAAEATAYKAVESGKSAARSADDIRKQLMDARRQTKDTYDTGATNRQGGTPESNAQRAGRERVTRNAGKMRMRNASSNVQKTVKTTQRTTKQTVKTAKQTVKTAEKTVKTAEKAVKTAAKATEKAAQAAAKTAQAAARAAQAAAKVAVAAAKAAAKAIVAIVRWIIAAVKALIAAIAAGGWVAVVIIVVVVLIIVLLSVFGVFASNEDGQPLTEAIQEIDSSFQTEINEQILTLQTENEADTVELIFEGDMGSIEESVSNWSDVVGVYAAKVSLDPENPVDVTVVTSENIEQLEAVFDDMNTVSYHVETETETHTVVDEYGATVYDSDGEPMSETITTLFIYVDVTSLDYREGASLYNLNPDQTEMLNELMRPDYYPLFAELLGDTVGDGGEFGFGLTINPDLPESELGAQIVTAAKRYIGRSYSSMDCSKLARTAYSDCGLSSMNGLSSVRMAKKCEEMGCLFTDPSQLQAGDLIFFARFDPSRGAEYCGDTGRCGTGKCRRWMHIHHVAIYINDEFLIDSTGGDNSVQIRRHWGMDTAKWKWVCFGRPAN